MMQLESTKSCVDDFPPDPMTQIRGQGLSPSLLGSYFVTNDSSPPPSSPPPIAGRSVMVIPNGFTPPPCSVGQIFGASQKNHGSIGFAGLLYNSLSSML
jgi:hypothetical protein